MGVSPVLLCGHRILGLYFPVFFKTCDLSMFRHHQYSIYCFYFSVFKEFLQQFSGKSNKYKS